MLNMLNCAEQCQWIITTKHTRTHARTHARTHIHSHTHTYTHTHTHTRIINNWRKNNRNPQGNRMRGRPTKHMVHGQWGRNAEKRSLLAEYREIETDSGTNTCTHTHTHTHTGTHTHTHIHTHTHTHTHTLSVILFTTSTRLVNKSYSHFRKNKNGQTLLK